MIIQIAQHITRLKLFADKTGGLVMSHQILFAAKVLYYTVHQIVS